MNNNERPGLYSVINAEWEDYINKQLFEKSSQPFMPQDIMHTLDSPQLKKAFDRLYTQGLTLFPRS
eukprot:3370570-Ditylum_brightwellii.AAC.2